jgi:restriction system protein
MAVTRFDQITHLPPDLFETLVEAIPKLMKSKQSLLDWFRQANVPDRFLAHHRNLLRRDREAFRKANVAREVLGDIVSGYSQDELLIGVMRNIVRRVAEWDSFAQSYPDDRLQAEVLVRRLREMIKHKDWFTRLDDAQEAQARTSQQQREADAQLIERRGQERRELKSRFNGLFGESDPVKRGLSLERLLNDWFRFEGIQICEPFQVRFGPDNKVLEQIDGVIQIDNWYYLLEIKWWSVPIGVKEVTHHVGKVFFRGNSVRGIFISYSDFTDPAIETARQALVQGSCECLIALRDIHEVLDRDVCLTTFLRDRIDETILRRNPLKSASMRSHR